MFTLAHSTLPTSLRGGTWTEMELLLLPARFKSPVNTAATGTSRDHTMQTDLTSHAFSKMLFPERNSFHPMLYAWTEAADTRHVYTIMCI